MSKSKKSQSNQAPKPDELDTAPVSLTASETVVHSDTAEVEPIATASTVYGEGEEVENPKEGDVIEHANGDKEVFMNGTWVVKVSASPHTGQTNY